MFIREKKNKSGSTSVQIISKHGGKYKVDRTIGSATTAQSLSILLHQARHELSLLQKQSSLFISHRDAGLLSNDNIKLLEHNGYKYILGARPKNETDIIRRQILQNKPGNDQHLIIARNDHTRLIISYSDKRASKDVHNRQRGLQRLEKQIKSGKLNKSNINNKGYNKYLKMQGDVAVSIDYEKFEADRNWDGIKGYITNTKLSASQIIDNYKQLWHIEKAFRMSKTDLRIRPIYHRLAGHIEAHICISFTAYKILKELERLLKKEKATFSVTKAVEITQNMYQIEVIMPETKNKRAILLKMTPEQIELSKIIAKNC